MRRRLHRDLPHIARAEQLRDLDRLRTVLLFDDHPAEWLLERRQAIEEALRRAR
jgi:hypothetical protein